MVLHKQNFLFQMLKYSITKVCVKKNEIKMIFDRKVPLKSTRKVNTNLKGTCFLLFLAFQ